LPDTIKLSALVRTVDVILEDDSLPAIQVTVPIPRVTPTVIDKAEQLYYTYLLGGDEEESDEDFESYDLEGLDPKEIRAVNIARIRRDISRVEKRMLTAEPEQHWYKAAGLLGQIGAESNLVDDQDQRIPINAETVSSRAFPWLYIWPAFRAVFFGYRPKETSVANSNAT
jgi:hypothetical protein